MKIILFFYALFIIIITKISTLKLAPNQVNNLVQKPEANQISNHNSIFERASKSVQDNNNYLNMGKIISFC